MWLVMVVDNGGLTNLVGSLLNSLLLPLDALYAVEQVGRGDDVHLKDIVIWRVYFFMGVLIVDVPNAMA